MTRETTYKGSTGNAFTMRGTINWGGEGKKSADAAKGGVKVATANPFVPVFSVVRRKPTNFKETVS